MISKTIDWMCDFIGIKVGDKAFKEISWSFATKFVTFFLFFAINIILARTLGVEKFGLWSFFYSVLTIVFVLSFFGINSSTKRYFAKFNDTEELRSIIKSAVGLRFLVSMIFALLMLVGHNSLANLLGKPELASLFLIAAPLVFVHGSIEFLKNAFMGLYRLKYNFLLNILDYGLKLGLIIYSLTVFGTLTSLVYSYLIASSIALVVCGFLLYKNFYLKAKVAKEEEKHTKEIMKYAMPLLFISFAYLVTTEVDTIMLGLMQGDHAVGIYAVSKEFITKLPHISLAIIMGTLPVFAKINSKNRDQLKKKFLKLIRFVSLMFFALFVLIILIAPFFVPFVYGVEYLESVLPMQILAFYIFGNSISLFISNLLDYAGRASRRAVNVTLGLILNIILNFLLIPIYGPAGAAMATAISFMPTLILNALEARKVFKGTV